MLNVHDERLANGLRLITLEAPHLHSALVAVYVRAGSRHEEARVNGVSHFLEHMFFRGSERFPDTEKMNGMVEDAGGSLNGCTLRDHGFYYTPVHPAHVDVALEVLGDMLCAPRLVDLELEREVILEEMLDEVDAEGRDIDPENLVRMRLFRDHPLSLKIAGTPDSVRAIQDADLRAHLERFYGAENMLVVVAGRVEREKVRATVERVFSPLRRGVAAVESAPVLLQGGFDFIAHDESQTAVHLAFPCAPEGHPDYPALMLLRRVLDDGLSSRLPREIVERRGLAYSVGAGIDSFSDVGIFEVDGACAPQKAPRVLEEMGRQLARLCEEPLSEEELERLRRRHRIGLEFTLDSPGDLVGWYAAALFMPPLSFEDRCRELEAVTPGRLMEVARRTFSKKHLAACAVGPKKNRAEEKLAKALEALPLP